MTEHAHKPNKQTKTILIIGAAGIALLLLYRWYSNRGATPTSGTPAPDTQGADYASLAGQEQGDVATLQQQNADLQGQLTDIENNILSLAGKLQQEIAALSMGHKRGTRKINTKHRHAFDKYYHHVTGHKPPLHILTTNKIWEAFKLGIPAHELKRWMHEHPPAQNRHHHVNHPNPHHQPRTGHHRPAARNELGGGHTHRHAPAHHPKTRQRHPRHAKR